MTPLATMTAAATAAGDVGPAQIEFADGLIGFPECRSFRLTAAPREGVYWLQSVDFEPLAFLLVDPFRFFDGYAVELSDVDVARLHATAPSDIAILATVTLGTGGATANLQGPLALNLASGGGRQVIAANSAFGVRAPFELPALD